MRSSLPCDANRSAIEERMRQPGDPIVSEAEELQERLDVLVGLMESGDLDPRDYAAAARPIRAKLDALEERRAERSAVPATAAVLASGAEVGSLPTDRLRAVLQELLVAIDVPKGRGEPVAVWRS